MVAQSSPRPQLCQLAGCGVKSVPPLLEVDALEALELDRDDADVCWLLLLLLNAAVVVPGSPARPIAKPMATNATTAMMAAMTRVGG